MPSCHGNGMYQGALTRGILLQFCEEVAMVSWRIHNLIWAISLAGKKHSFVKSLNENVPSDLQESRNSL